MLLLLLLLVKARGAPLGTRLALPMAMETAAAAATVVVPDLVGVPPAVVHPGERREGAEGEPEEARGSPEHRVVESVVSVPEQVVRGHAIIRIKDGVELVS